MGGETLVNYEDLGNPTVIVHIYGRSFPIIDLGARIKILTVETYQALDNTALEPTTTLLELVDCSLVRPEGTLQDITIFVD